MWANWPSRQSAAIISLVALAVVASTLVIRDGVPEGLTTVMLGISDPVSAALEAHENKAAAPTAPAKQQELAGTLSSIKSQNYEDHPWDPQNPEGMPMADGRLISAASFFEQAGAPPPPPAKKSRASPFAQADTEHSHASPAAKQSNGMQRPALQSESVMAGGGSQDPMLGAALNAAFAEHENGFHVQGPKLAPETAGGSKPAAQPQPAELERGGGGQQAGGGQGKAGADQGFVTGSKLRVTAREFHREMRRYMPSSDGRLVSPFEWFQAMGRPAPPAKNLKPAQ